MKSPPAWSRRRFVRHAGAAVAAVSSGGACLNAGALKMPLGVQAYDLKPALTGDFDGTWKELAGFGYRMIDMVSFRGYGFPAPLSAMPAKDIRRALDANGLRCEICHFTAEEFAGNYGKAVAYAHDLGARTAVSTATRGRTATADNWRWQAGRLNDLAQQARKDGIAIDYHNHEAEFKDVDGIIPWDVLIRGTDPSLVGFQIDVGNLAAASKNPLTWIRKYPDRYNAAHLKDVAGGKLGVAVGEGDLDWKKIFPALAATKVRNYAVETGARSDEMLSKYKSSIDFIRRLDV
jgi:sugar phosphate isomerase/epimerase